jgi:hypothetical protein
MSIAGFELGGLYERGVPPADSARRGWPADPANAEFWYGEAAKRREPNALARLAERTEFDAVTGSSAPNDAQLLTAFTLYARATAQAEALGWPPDVSRSWRYRRASLARVLAADGMMREAADAYGSVLRETR